MKKRIKKNRLKAILMIAVVPLFLSACGTSAINSHSTGFWDHTILYNLGRLIIWLSGKTGGYGMGIIMITILFRIVILPLMIYQVRSMKKIQEIQPAITALQKKYSSKDAATQQKLQEEMMKLYSEAGYNPISGCLPLLVQMPIIWALYQAIYRTHVLRTGTFLWMSLGGKDPYYVLPILAALFTWLSSWLTMKSQPETNAMSNMMLWWMPASIFIGALYVPSALSLYWVVSNAFQVLQTLVIQNPWKINRERAAKEAEKKEKERAKKRAIKKINRSKKKKK